MRAGICNCRGVVERAPSSVQRRNGGDVQLGANHRAVETVDDAATGALDRSHERWRGLCLSTLLPQPQIKERPGDRWWRGVRPVTAREAIDFVRELHRWRLNDSELRTAYKGEPTQERARDARACDAEATVQPSRRSLFLHCESRNKHLTGKPSNYAVASPRTRSECRWAPRHSLPFRGRNIAGGDLEPGCCSRRVGVSTPGPRTPRQCLGTGHRIHRNDSPGRCPTPTRLVEVQRAWLDTSAQPDHVSTSYC